MAWFDDSKYTKFKVVRFIRTRRLAINAYKSVVRGSKMPLMPPSKDSNLWKQ